MTNYISKNKKQKTINIFLIVQLLILNYECFGQKVDKNERVCIDNEVEKKVLLDSLVSANIRTHIAKQISLSRLKNTSNLYEGGINKAKTSINRLPSSQRKRNNDQNNEFEDNNDYISRYTTQKKITDDSIKTESKELSSMEEKFPYLKNIGKTDNTIKESMALSLDFSIKMADSTTTNVIPKNSQKNSFIYTICLKKDDDTKKFKAKLIISFSLPNNNEQNQQYKLKIFEKNCFNPKDNKEYPASFTTGKSVNNLKYNFISLQLDTFEFIFQRTYTFVVIYKETEIFTMPIFQFTVDNPENCRQN